MKMTYCQDSLKCFKQFLDCVTDVFNDMYWCVTSNKEEMKDNYLNHLYNEILIENVNKFNQNLERRMKLA